MVRRLGNAPSQTEADSFTDYPSSLEVYRRLWCLRLVLSQLPSVLQTDALLLSYKDWSELQESDLCCSRSQTGCHTTRRNSDVA